MDRITRLCAEKDLVLLEDCCESLSASFDGQPVGTFGLAATFSFFFSHHITTMEGGLIHTSNDELADLLRLMRAHGWTRNIGHETEASPGIDPRYTFLNWGFNVRPTELQAGFGLVQLGRLPAFQHKRIANAEHFLERLSPWHAVLRSMTVHPKAECSWFALPLMLTPEAPFHRNELTQYLELNGVETRPIVAGNIARHPVARLFPEVFSDALPGADVIHDRGFYIGIHPVDEGATIDRLCDLIDSFLECHV
jgi:CDP-6-deoxy-D-xylo-4-hexulose-3-dehydrase